MNTILVVEDDKEVRDTIVDLLEGAGYSAIPKYNGIEAVSFLESNIPDLVISDVMMPHIDGYQLLEYFKKLPATAAVPFIFISAKSSFLDIRNGMLSGADDYITKPFRAKELLQSIETQLKKKEKVDMEFEKISMTISSYLPHELLTPLISILGYPEIIADEFSELSKSEVLRMLQKIKSAGSRLHKTIRKYLRFTEIQSKLIAKKNSDYSAFAGSSFPAVLIPLICKKNALEHERENDLILDIAEAEINIPENDFEFIIDEMLTNAHKFSNQGTFISVTGKVTGSVYCINVKDYGRGITKEQLVEILPFVQHDRNQYQHSGSGLGLVTIKKMMDYYGGEFKLSSVANEYTVCTVSLPIVCY